MALTRPKEQPTHATVSYRAYNDALQKRLDATGAPPARFSKRPPATLAEAIARLRAHLDSRQVP